jgi:hypothetical protein
MTLTDPVNSAQNDPAHGGKVKLVDHVNAIRSSRPLWTSRTTSRTRCRSRGT